MMTVAPTDIFIHDPEEQQFAKSALLALHIKSAFVLSLADHLGLTFNEWDTAGNLCFALSNDLQAEYKLVLTREDIRNYLARTLQDRTYHMVTDRIVFPKTMVL